MSKIICEICGTSYPETTEQCPICGYTNDFGSMISRDDIEAPSAPKAAPRTSVRGSTDDAPPAKKAPAKTGASRSAAPKEAPAKKGSVKGGKFSQANVRKRNQAEPPRKTRAAQPPEDDDRSDRRQPRESNAVLVVLLLIVIVALLAVTGYIALKYFIPYVNQEETVPETVATEPAQEQEETAPLNIACTSLVLTSGGTVKLEEVGQNWLLNVIVLPIDSTDALVFTSSDETVATVSSDGKITAVGIGEAVITISCGDQSMECKVICGGTEETEPPVEATEPEATEKPTEA